MLAHTDNYFEDRFASILITNHCNWSCGSCGQRIGLIPKEKVWSIDLQELRDTIDFIILNQKLPMIRIMGGEPTVHREWSAILDLFTTYPDTKFLIASNGSKPQDLPSNVEFQVYNDTKDRGFTPVLAAPADLYPNEDYVEMAKKNCKAINNGLYINRGRFYVCCPGGAADSYVNDGKAGWSISADTPYQKSEQEREEQMRQMCYRCGFCLPAEDQEKYAQNTNDPQYLATPVNVVELKGHTRLKNA
jgi:organic radical activating enzyme